MARNLVNTFNAENVVLAALNLPANGDPGVRAVILTAIVHAMDYEFVKEYEEGRHGYTAVFDRLHDECPAFRQEVRGARIERIEREHFEIEAELDAEEAAAAGEGGE